MRDIVTPMQIYPALQALLGLPDHCISFELRVAAGQCGVTVSCEHYVALDAPGIQQLESVLSEYELVRKSAPLTEGSQQQDNLSEPLAELAAPLVRLDAAKAQSIGFDAWMSERDERAHREFMDSTSRLPA